MVNKTVSIIIVNYNGKDWLLGCLDSLRKQVYKPVEIIVVDNASNDGSVDMVRKNYPEVILVINKNNLGYAEGNNLGYKKAKGNYILFLNNDTVVEKDFLIHLVFKLDKEGDLGGAQSKLLLINAHDTLDCCGSFLTSTGFLYHYGYGREDNPKYNREFDIFSAKGASMIFKRDVLEKVKVDGEVFDKLYFAYFEETDLCQRIWMSGNKIKYIPTSVVYHKQGATSSRLNKFFVQYHSYKNRINTYLKNLEYYDMIRILPLHIVLSFLVSLVYLLRLDFSLFLAINRSIVWNITNLPQTLKKRKYILNHIRNKKSAGYIGKITFNPGLDYYIRLFTGLQIYNFEKDNVNGK